MFATVAAERAPILVESIARLAPVVSFGAAVPHQGGGPGRNRHWPAWWAVLVAQSGLTRRGLGGTSVRPATFERLAQAQPMVAVALPHAAKHSGLTWRLARRDHTRVVRQISEADVGATVVLVFKVVGRGNTSLVFALTRGDTSARAIEAVTQKIRSI